MSLNSQAKALFASASFLKQKHRETLVSHLLTVTHAFVKHALLTSPSSSSPFSEDVIRESLTEVKEDSHLKLLWSLSSSSRGGKQTTLSVSSSGQRHGSSSSSLCHHCHRHLPLRRSLRRGALVAPSVLLLLLHCRHEA